MNTTTTAKAATGISARVGRCLDCAADLHTDPVTGRYVDRWGQDQCGASAGPHTPDLPEHPGT